MTTESSFLWVIILKNFHAYPVYFLGWQRWDPMNERCLVMNKQIKSSDGQYSYFEISTVESISEHLLPYTKKLLIIEREWRRIVPLFPVLLEWSVCIFIKNDETTAHSTESIGRWWIAHDDMISCVREEQFTFVSASSKRWRIDAKQTYLRKYSWLMTARRRFPIVYHRRQDWVYGVISTEWFIDEETKSAKPS